MSLPTPRRQRASGASTNLPLESPASPNSQPFSKAATPAAKSGLQHFLRHPRKNTLSTTRIEPPVLPSSAFTIYSNKPPVLTLPASPLVKTSPFSALQTEPQKDAPKHCQTYKLFPSSSPPPQIISPVYGVNVLHRNIESKDYQVVLPRLRDTQNCSSFNSTPLMSTEKHPKVAHMGRNNGIDEHPLTISDPPARQRDKVKEKNEDHKKSTRHIGRRVSQPRTFHKENINHVPPSRQNENRQGLKLGRCLRIKSQSLRNRPQLPVKAMEASSESQKNTDLSTTGRRNKVSNSFSFYRARGS